MSLVFETGEFTLIGPRSEQQLVVTGTYASGDIRDTTHISALISSDAGIVRIENGIARPAGDGTATITATIGGVTVTTKATVKETQVAHPVSFKTDTLAALNKSGCNMGACHGSPSGKGGFRLSLRGFDPPLDILTLRSEFFGRRANVLKPDDSLILRKPLMEIAHGGGRRLVKGDASWRALHGWIAEGLQLDKEGTPDLVRIEAGPPARILRQDADRQQLYVNGYFSDGTVRDLTALTVFSSSNESVATVAPSGLVEKIGRGETAILARYLDKMSTAYVTFLEDVPGFKWSNPAENNFVDKLVFQKLQQLQILPSDLCSEEEFLRRAYLDLTGRLPVIEETLAYLDDKSGDKRTQLVDQLLAEEDFAEFWTLKWSDILRSNSKKVTATGVHKFQRWI
ncbi:MAG: DUF1549 domain-containing protein [Planctomycetaceae bacterium]